MFGGDFQIYVPTDVAMAMAQIKEVKSYMFFFFKMTCLKKTFSSLTPEMQISKYQLVTLPIFAMFRPQTTKILPFKVECLSTKH